MIKGEELNPISILYGLLEAHKEPACAHARIVIPVKRSQRKTSKQVITRESSGVSVAKQINTIISHPTFRNYKLTKQDVAVIALLWKRHIDNVGAASSWSTLCGEIGMNIYNTNACLDYITNLLDRNIISFNEITRSDYHLNPSVLLAGEYLLSNEMILKILGKNIPEDVMRLIANPWLQNSDFIYDLKQSLNLIFNCFGELDSSRRRAQALNPAVLFACQEPILHKLEKSSSDLAIKQLIIEFSLDKIEIIILLLVLYAQLTQDDLMTEKALMRLICQTNQDEREYQKYLQPNAKLIHNNLISIGEINTFVNRKDLSIPDPIKQRLCEDRKVNGQSLQYYLSQNNALQLIKSEQQINDLIIPTKDIQILESLTKRYLLQLKSNQSNSTGGLVALFYGSPGTGKTYAAGALANALNKDLIELDCSALRNCYYSESEKSVKKVFRIMQTMSVELNNPPVFLINEADQLIHFRTDRANFSSRTDNSIQNIILEELEHFTGILILTTNLENNIDEAYFRRIHLKLKFNPPDYDCRCKLWKLHLKHYPVESDIDVSMLASSYLFTGGQIALVLQNAHGEVITRKPNLQFITFNDIVKYADLERPWADSKHRKSVGF
jgi:DNA replication protein DnaC